MKVNNKLILELAELCKLKFDKDTMRKMKSDLKNILNFVNKLSEIETKNIEPLIYMSEEVNKMRSDTATESLSQKDTLKNAPEKDSDYFKVPTVLKKL